MIYQVKYRFDTPKLSADDIRLIDIKYRPEGTLRWHEIHRELWSFATRKWGDEYSFERNRSYLYNHAVLFQKIINERYGGSLDQYVADLVRHEILKETAERTEFEVANEIILRFKTKGWKKCTVEVAKT